MQVHCIEFPSILLPPGCTQGSIVSISCSRNAAEERARSDEFWSLQDDILTAFGQVSPTPPSLRLRNVTQTSVTLEWDKLQLATSKLLSLTIWRNGQRLAAIPNPLNNTSTKVSGLDVDAPYSFHLIMRTTAGTFSSQTIKTRTLTLTDTSGINVCFGIVEPPELLEQAQQALEAMHARFSSRIQIDTTHFVCTHPSGELPTPSTSPSASTAAINAAPPPPNSAVEYQRAVQLSIPIVKPSWVLSCQREKKMVAINQHYLDKNTPPYQPAQNSSRSTSNRGAATAAPPIPGSSTSGAGSTAPASAQQASSGSSPQSPPRPTEEVREPATDQAEDQEPPPSSSVDALDEQQAIEAELEKEAEEPKVAAADQLETEMTRLSTEDEQEATAMPSVDEPEGRSEEAEVPLAAVSEGEPAHKDGINDDIAEGKPDDGDEEQAGFTLTPSAIQEVSAEEDDGEAEAEAENKEAGEEVKADEEEKSKRGSMDNVSL